ncbi:bacterioferritin (cytochrome b1) [Candidatus Methanoperedens nitroreducens]|uniref:Bacterioferritin (Cytochrome b1) n=1 Tax=Candidatus Methanoperedens nitratireducens TaxID=1392998 RepID=A0A062V569_9EURY|nr:ferritin-like domain-containing protein [Candidatus Methanoperedens nitroreducens]KCZ72447.1 bacterioferritin (cytochrome b1) [Candidatus Methanoperedens nitroreducens]MDJ1423619.1 ferritin-like domain-containing protein [Candidatus Methanoperedens sp.]
MNEKIIDALNKDREQELSAIIQYMKHHYEGQGMESPEILDKEREIAIAEMRHAESLGERINYLGGVPTKSVSHIAEGGDLRKMIQDDLAKENTAIKQYKEHIKLAAEEGDITTRVMLEQILKEEEDHANTWETVLGVKK